MTLVHKMILIAGLTLVVAIAAFGQEIYRPEGMNMPGAYDEVGSVWNNPPTIPVFSGIEAGGNFLLDTGLAVHRYTTLIHVDEAGADIVPGTYPFLFTSGPSGSYYQNKWGGTTVIFDSLQDNTIGGSDNSVTVSAAKYYTVNFRDHGYQNSSAIWMQTSSAPPPILSVSQSPLAGSVTAGNPVTVNVGIGFSKPPEDTVYVRYTVDNWATSALAPVLFGPTASSSRTALNVAGTSGTATIPGEPGGTLVRYYVLSTTIPGLASDFDMKTLKYNNNGGANYSYTITSPTYTITATAGSHGSITPSGAVLVTSGHDTTLTFTPDPGYFVDSIIVDNSFAGDSSSYTFHNVQSNHAIHVAFAHNVNVLFQVNMAVKIRKGEFKPDSDAVTVRGTFNDFGNSTNNPDTLKDPNHDSIYTKIIPLHETRGIEYKFWKTDRAGEGYENNIPNRTHFVPDAVNDTIPAVWFDNDAPIYIVTFQVDMSIQMRLGNFRPDLGDVVTIRGTFNDFGNSTNNPDTLKDPNLDSIYTKLLPLAAGTAQDYKFWKTLRNAVDYEVLPAGPFVNRSYNVPYHDDVVAVHYFSDDTSVAAISISYATAWNLLSLPVSVGDPSKAGLYPFPSSPLFGYNGAYVVSDTAFIGQGYWLRLNAGQKVIYNGDAVTSKSIDVADGWNMIGAISLPLNTASVTSVPPDIISSRFYGYGSSYTTVTSLQPGFGYWVKVKQAGQLILNSGPSRAGEPDAVSPQKYGRLTIRDVEGHVQRLLVGRSVPAQALSLAELPPLPPLGVFDVRFGSNRSLESVADGEAKTFPVAVSAARFPVSVSWESADLPASAVFGGARNSSGTRWQATIPDGTTRIELSVSGSLSVPHEFSLGQNYPNPFNPATHVEFSVPAEQFVSLMVYNVLGQEVATLVNEVRQPGRYAVEWDASNQPSGVYYYRIAAGSFTATKALILLK